MPNAHQIRLRLSDWINGKTSLAEFDDWFVPATWDIHKSGDREAESLVDDIELNSSEYSGGHLSKDQLITAMKTLMESPMRIQVEASFAALDADRSSNASR